MSYENAPATVMLATHCCCCGRPLVDAMSVELGIGPECRNGRTGDITEEQRVVCNRLTHDAAVAAQEGNVVRVRQIAEQIGTLGLSTLAQKVAERFVNAERNAKVKIVQIGDSLRVTTPFRRSQKAEFVAAWRTVPGRRYERGCNVVPVTSKRELWSLLRRFFPGEFGVGPQGAFRIPK
jgi:hypothetical protein